jgi:hypothetical protein
MNPLGPVFISYRHSDGALVAEELAWAMRAAGIPVWRDENDLLPGETESRLTDAICSGLSGAVLVITPEVRESRIIREVELPAILREQATPGFVFSIASTIADPNDPLRADLAAPDRLLGPLDRPLATFDVALVDTVDSRNNLARQMAVSRLQGLRPQIAADGGELIIDLQTRVPPIATAHDSHLVIRLRPPAVGTGVPNPAGLADLQGLLAWLPELVAHSGATSILVKGGAHLTVALALGAALPTTLFSKMSVLDTRGDRWCLTGQAPLDLDRTLIERTSAEEDGYQGSGGRGPVAVFVDMVTAATPWPFRDLIAGRSFAGVAHLRPVTPGQLQAEDAPDLVGQIADQIRRLRAEHGTAEVHLACASPFPLAVLLGRALNTLMVHAYERDTAASQTGAPDEYVPSMVIRSGVGGSPLIWVTGQPPLHGS